MPYPGRCRLCGRCDGYPVVKSAALIVDRSVDFSLAGSPQRVFVGDCAIYPGFNFAEVLIGTWQLVEVVDAVIDGLLFVLADWQ